MSTTREDWATAKSLVREWLMEKGIALTGVNGEASRSTVHRFKLDLRRRVVGVIITERERAAKIAESAFMPAHTYASEHAERYHAFDDGQKHAIVKIAAMIREGKPLE